MMRRSFVNRRRGFGLSQMQIGHEDQDYRRDDAESQIRVHDREQPTERAGIRGVVSGSDSPDECASSESGERGNVAAETGDAERTAAARTNEVVRVRCNFPSRNDGHAIRALASRHNAPPK
jgi:hypothetical protein